jgi:acetylornithine deacetylase
VNAIDVAVDDIAWIRSKPFARMSDVLGGVQMTVTQIQAGQQHNVVPDECRFVVDVRVPDVYTHEEVLATVRAHVASTVEPRSMRLRSSAIDANHPLVQAGRRLGMETYGSPTMSDMALMPPIAKLKIGPGDSARSHTPNEWLGLDELQNGLEQMYKLTREFLGTAG